MFTTMFTTGFGNFVITLMERCLEDEINRHEQEDHFGSNWEKLKKH